MTIEIRRAVAYDEAVVVRHAFMRYISHIGKQPSPMIDDYQAVDRVRFR